jgi:hypothetical protein
MTTLHSAAVLLLAVCAPALAQSPASIQKRSRLACDSYSCEYQNISWRSDTQALVPDVNPRLIFERLFGAADPVESAPLALTGRCTGRSG